MKRKRFLLITGLMMVLVMLLTACSSTPTGTSPEKTPAEPKTALTISAAASLTDALQEMKDQCEKETNTELTFQFAASGTLQRQIEQGAPADVFISAAATQMNALQKQDLLVTETRKDLLKNELVLVVPKDAATVKDFPDLTGEKVKKVAIGVPDSVPAGKYAQETLKYQGLWEQVEPKLVLAKDVRQVLAYVETGEVDAGMVYRTDAKISDKVKITASAPVGSHTPVVYPVAIIKDTKNLDAAKKFVDYLTGEQAKAVFTKHGFTVTAK
ncbi:MAG: molybdate ABC transporter substrate-binding protein [Heliobacteriaceae bacterium]|nr:molybdate ABC transporter substrate-binding protein [Heliobacteriaceae bacterium]MDD4588268.1 molybdate ABC transporter substrate-binding protein [Heliobacteriaceae bacterium]